VVYFTTLSLYEVTQRRGYDDGMNNQNLCTNIREMIKILFWPHSKRTEGQTQKPLLKIAGSSTDIGISTTRKRAYSITATETTVFTVLLFC
jgi:hypothetical protein